MKTFIFFRISLLMLLFAGPVAFSQVTNGGSYNMEVHFLQNWGMIDTDGPLGGNPEQSVIATARNNTDGIPKQLFDKSSGAVNNPKICYTYGITTNDWGPLADLNMGTILNSSTGVFDYEVYSWEDDAGDRCTWDTDDDSRGFYFNFINTLGQPPASWIAHPEQSVVNNTKFKMKYTWRYVNGEKTSPLDFGTLSNATYTHINTNRGVPSGANTALGYKNQWTWIDDSNELFKDGNDVTYKFRITDSRRILLSAAYPETNFDAYIHLVKFNEDGTLNSYIDRNNYGSSNWQLIIQKDLCPGLYGVIVEGWYSTDMGNFKLTLQSTEIYTPGTIKINGSATSMIIPTPHEQASGTITSEVNGNGVPPFTITWQKNNGGGWVDTLVNAQTFTIPVLRTLPATQSTTISFRRKIPPFCPSTSAYSNEVSIKVVIPNGQISGRVVSKTGTGVNNVTITAVRTSTPPSGGVANKTYTTTTGIDGYYNFSSQGIYYGDPESGSGASAMFRITPSKGTHGFKAAFLDKQMTQLAPLVENVNFTDTTVFSITGRITQECATCNGPPTPLVCNIKDVEFLVDNTYLGNKTIADGTYGISVDEQRNYTIKPRYKNHKFVPNQVVLAVGETQSIPNINFKDTTTFTISGKVLAGCQEYIGQATLRFTQVLPPINGNPVSGCLVKDITTNALTGYYSIRLPAGKYRASVQSVTLGGTGTDLIALTVTDFLNNKVLIQDSLIRDIDTTNRVLNLVYPRAPILELIGLDTVCTPTTNICGSGTVTPLYSLMAQNDSTAFTIKVWQGQVNTCPAKDSLVYLSTNIQQDDTSEDFAFVNSTGVIPMKLKGGIPNIVCPYFKTFNLRYTDKFKRAAESINKNVVVTGLKADIGTFATVSPEIPLKVLHDPPGDNSYSFWEANTSTEEAIRMFRSESDNVSRWEEIKLGTKFEAGIGLAVETKVWGSIKGTLGVGGKNVSANETILSVSTSQRYSTANNPGVVGSQGDVFIGSAINLLYSKVHIISDSACTLRKKTDFIIAPNGFATDYVYSENHISSTVLPTLRAFRDNPSNTVPEKAKYSNQVSIWEQILSNNARNKKTAPFEKNISFDGSAGAISSTTTTTTTKTNTIEFGVELDADLAAELGFESSGSGVSGGVVVKTKMETGKSSTNKVINSTSTGYVLDDKDNGDYFSIDIKKDPIYSTPVFELVAGTSSCPWEDGTQPRDDMQLVCAVPTQTVADPAGEAEFILQLSNISQSGEARTYALSFDQSSNPNGAVVTIGGSPVVGITNYTIAYGGSVQVIVKVKKGASNVFSYTGLKFKLSDNCGSDISKSVSLNAYFNSPCSTISLVAPSNGFKINTNIVPIIMKDYTVANLSSVTLEYSKVGTSSWFSGFTRTAAQLSTDPSGTQVNWDISTLTDGQYNFRLKLLCSSNVIFTPTITGEIDRLAPILFGNPEPTDDNYVIGDQISATYNEILGCANMNSTNLILKNLKTNAIIPAQLGCFENKVMIMPLSSMGVLNDSMRVTLQNIRDVSGNVKTAADSWVFVLGNSVTATGNNAISLNQSNVITSPQTETKGVSTANVSISMMENATGTLDFYFNLPANAPNDYLINYSVSGSANAGNDYTVSFSPSNFTNGRKINSNRFNGTYGTITILAGQKTAKLSIDPTGDSVFEGDETIIITVNEGGDYGIGASYTMTATILNEDSDPCLNDGNVYVLSNNNAGNTAIVAGTYHKSLLETTGTVESPSNVSMKGAKSVTMKPGFQVKAGSIFTANIEGCPQAPAAFSVPITENSNQTSNNVLVASNNEGLTTSVAEPTSAIQFEPNIFAAVNDKKVFFEFKLDKDENVTLVLLNDYAGEQLRIIDGESYKAGVYNVEIETSTLKKGDYYLKLTTNNKKTYQKITIK